MIIRLILAGFSSLVAGVCYLSGMMRVMSGLLLAFGVLSALFFGIVFTLPASDDRLWFPIHGTGAAWPFFLLALCLSALICYLFLAESKPAAEEQLVSKHLKYLGAGLLLYLFALFLPAFLWFPSEEKRLTLEISRLGLEVFIGVCLYLAGSCGALFLLYRSTKGSTSQRPELMRRFVPALFSILHLDKIPALVAYLLIYSPETQIIFPKIAALALAAYIPIALFFIQISREHRG